VLFCRINFLVDVIGGDVNDLMAFPQYAMLSLADTIGPRYYFLARQGWLDSFTELSSGMLQLARVMQPELKAFLADVAQVGPAVVAGRTAGHFILHCYSTGLESTCLAPGWLLAAATFNVQPMASCA
jgi:hypothetical protein